MPDGVIPLEELSTAPEFTDYTLNKPASPLNKYTRLTNVLEKRDQRVKKSSSSSMIDYSYLRAVIYNRSHLSDEQRQCLKHALWYSKYTQVGYRNQYLDNLGFIILAEPTFLIRYCRCGEQGAVCDKRTWCPRCAYAVVTSLWKEYLLSYNAGTFYFLTVSLVGDVPFTDENAFDLPGLWKILTTSLQVLQCKLKGCVRGMLISDEISVRQFLPIRINPHVHAILDADDPLHFYEALKPVIDAFLTKHAPGYTLQASVNMRVITSQNSLKSALQYLVKPIQIKIPYRTAWDGKVVNGLGRAWALNSEVKDFVRYTNYVSHTPRLIQHIKRYGSLSANSSNYIGTPEARRNDHWDKIKSVSLSDDEWADYSDHCV